MGLETLLLAFIEKVGEFAFTALDYIVKDTSLTYKEIMEYFIEHQKDDDRIVKGAMFKEKTQDNKIVLFQVFLDNDNKIIEKDGHALGRKVTAVGLDDETLRVFRDQNVVIVG